MSSAPDVDLNGIFSPAAPGSYSPYAVKLTVFEGPLDLLLHLIRLNEVEITEIPIARIADQYLEYLGLMRDLDLDVAGEYLVMAATLAWIKSRMLLPSSPDDDDGGEEPDPRTELVARLLEYRRFKQAATQLGEQRLLGRDVFAARTPDIGRAPESEREIDVGLFQLIEAYREVLQRTRGGVTSHDIEMETLTVADRMLVMMRLLEARGSIDFDRIFVECDDRAPSRLMIVTTFLALLELVRLAALRVYQSLSDSGVPSGPIHVRLAAASDPRPANP
ncbi:MAG: segregation/condensation protein A [Myxococcota bacterium]